LSILQTINLAKKYSQAKDFAVHNFNLEIEKGEIVAITGESGCGKTTLLRLIAGLEVPNSGSISIYNQLVADDQTWVKPEKRKVGMVFQDYALFPHLTVQENIAFGLQKDIDKKQLINELLALVGLETYEKRYPHELSGGQQQRVALARALAPSPTVLLLDEPFSNLDEVLKEQVREELHQIIRQSNMTTLLVTHDTKDALTMADRIAVMKKGILQQCSSPQQLYEKPTNEYAASFFGKINIIDKQNLIAANLPTEHQKIGVRPEHIFISKISDLSANRLMGIIQKIHFFGAYQEILISVNEQEIVVKITEQANWQIGDRVSLTFKQFFILENIH
jgi:iron(III) transport system ATP-binding protein